MPRKTLFWSLYPPLALLVVAGLLAAVYLTASLLRQEAIEQQRAALYHQTRLVAKLVREPLAGQDSAAIEAAVERLGQQLDLRITVVTPEGVPAADSSAGPEENPPRADHPEFAQAANGGRGEAIRKSFAAGTDVLYLALPVRNNEQQLLGVVRLARPLTSLEPGRRTLLPGTALLGGVLLLTAALVSLLLARSLGRPLRVLQDSLKAAAAGRPPGRVGVEGPQEIELLARSIQQRTGELLARIEALQGRLNEQKAVLSSMWGRWWPSTGRNGY